jgi:NADH-ubiquinone oxidoreductase chain 1
MFLGIFHPFSDAIRLFSREQYFPLVSNYLSYYFSPVFGCFLSLFIWVLMPYFRVVFSFELGLLFLYAVLVWGFILLWLLVGLLILTIHY